MIGQAVQTVLFYGFAALGILLAIGTIASRNILRAAVCLMGVLVVSSGYNLMLGAEFLAGVQVLVYVGGIVVLLVFAIMLTGSAELKEQRPSAVRMLTGFAAAAAFLATAVSLFLGTRFPTRAGQPVADTTAALGLKLLDDTATGYVLPFELISLLLLAAAIGGIVVARKTPPPAEQVRQVANLPKQRQIGNLPHVTERTPA